MVDFWIPQFKYQLVEWLEKYYPLDERGIQINWGRGKKNVLMAIYIKVRREARGIKKSCSVPSLIRETQLTFDWGIA